MESLFVKLYEKCTKLQKKNFSESDEVLKEQEKNFIDFVSASEKLIQYMTSENDNLKYIVEDLRSEIISIRSSKEKECLERQKLLAEANQKYDALSKEVDILKKKIHEKHPHNNSNNDQSGRKQQPTKTHESADGSSSFTFQDLCGHLLGMKLSTETKGEQVYFKLSTETKGEQVYFIFTHPPSGLSFSLTSLSNSTGEEPEFLYKVVSLGMFERVVPEWMREDLVFSTSMCHVFFEKVSQAIKLKG